MKIGFSSDILTNNANKKETITGLQKSAPKKSVVQVYFEKRGMTLAYYNDKFDLKSGDIVYVDGKLEGYRGRVVEVNYNFRIKISDYKRVVYVADTSVSGQFFMAGSHFITFDREALPKTKVSAWFKEPAKEDNNYVSGSDKTSFSLDELNKMQVSSQIAERGYEYYADNKVSYICIDRGYGYAIVEGSQTYEVEFEYHGGRISKMTCSCFCGYNCKHEVAAMLQLREAFQTIEKYYAKEYENTEYFAAICKATLFLLAIDKEAPGSFTLTKD